MCCWFSHASTVFLWFPKNNTFTEKVHPCVAQDGNSFIFSHPSFSQGDTLGEVIGEEWLLNMVIRLENELFK